MTRQGINEPEEIHADDFIRGLGLLGILLLTTQTYSRLAFLRPQSLYALPVESAHSYTPMQFFLHLLVGGPFFGLFSVGVGWGFYRRWQTDQQAGLQAGRLARRGLWAWLGLGLLHGLVVGAGDLLHLYALLGFGLVYFVRQSVSTLLLWIAGLISLVVLIEIIQFLVFSPWPPALAAPEPSVGALTGQFAHPWQYGSFWEVVCGQPAGQLRLHTRAMGQSLTHCVYLEVMVLMGVLVGKLDLVDRLPQVRVRLSLLILLLFPLAIGLKGVSSLSVVELPLLPARWQAYQPLVLSLGDFLGTPLLTLVYLLEIGLNLRPNLHRVVVWVGQVGRMSLTNYLLQSGLCVFLFDEDGLSPSGKLSVLETLGVVLLLYSLQLWFSQWWLSRSPQGPVEQLLNRWIYRKRGAGRQPR